jgi:hypothetical protein
LRGLEVIRKMVVGCDSTPAVTRGEDK